MLVFLFNVACSVETQIQSNQNVADNITTTEQTMEVVEDIAFLSELFEEFQDINQTAEPMMYNERHYAENYSATGIVLSTYDIFSDLYLDDENNGCPNIRESSDSIAIRGGCTTEEKIQYDGRIALKIYDEVMEVKFQNFTILEESPYCLGSYDSVSYQGGLVWSEEEATVLLRKNIVEFDKSCKAKEISYWYQSNLDMELDDFESDFFWNGTYNGTGTVLQVTDGAQFIDFITIDQRIESDVCRFEPMSGSNVITNGIDTFEFLYDGEKDCDMRPTQMLSINGGDTKEVFGASCSKINGASSWIVFLLSFFPVYIRSSRRC